MTQKEFKTLKIGDKVKSLVNETLGVRAGRVYEVTMIYTEGASLFGYQIGIKVNNVSRAWPMNLSQVELVKDKSIKNLRTRIKKDV